MKMKALLGFALAIIVAVFAFALFSGVSSAWDWTTDPADAMLENFKFVKNIMIWFMLMLVAFLMLFIKKYEWGVCLAVLLSAAGSFVLYLFAHTAVLGDGWNQDLMLMGVICAITVVIAIGCFLGQLKMWQYLLVGILFVPVFLLVEWIMFGFSHNSTAYFDSTILPSGEWVYPDATPSILSGLFGFDASDDGGSMLVHMCAAYFGVGVAIALRDKRAFNEPMYTTTHSTSFVWLAAMLLWVLWPAFVTALLPAEDVFQGMVVCYMGGIGSVISAWVVCSLVQKKVNPLIYTYAMLAGPVAIGAPLLMIGPWGAIVVGIIAGIISALSFIYLHPFFCKKLGALDVMGVHNLHGVAGWFGAIVSVVCLAMAAGTEEAATNLIAAVLVFVVTLFLGMFVGLIVRASRGSYPDERMFNDDVDFIKNEAPE